MKAMSEGMNERKRVAKRRSAMKATDERANDGNDERSDKAIILIVAAINEERNDEFYSSKAMSVIGNPRTIFS